MVTEEEDYIGSHGFVDAKPELRLFSEIPGWEDLPYLNPGALTGVWAEDNTRQAIFDAFKRKETFATSGTRAQVRVFAGWNFPRNLHRQRDGVAQAYAQGVPMGGDLGKAPSFLVAALKDPISANLDRVQILKGWLDDRGETQEKIYDVVWSGSRQPGADGKLPPVGNTVNTDTPEWTNTIGAVELATVWTDPDSDPSQRAFYYARVLEIPTPRWTTYDQVRFQAGQFELNRSVSGLADAYYVNGGATSTNGQGNNNPMSWLGLGATLGGYLWPGGTLELTYGRVVASNDNSPNGEQVRLWLLQAF